jgi:hypothetical protein
VGRPAPCPFLALSTFAALYQVGSDWGHSGRASDIANR